MCNKELVLDMRRSKPLITTISIGGVNVDIVEEYGLVIDNKLNFSEKTDAIYRNDQIPL